jgi:glycine/D-amino acid oxidase-like deaminating enzyme/nitrite reductase/ring-hydroxylating ferredoxin subunit
MPTRSYWKQTQIGEFPALRENIRVDVAVIGAGMTGISAAYLLKRAGRRVALIERDRCAQVNTGNTTAHLTCVTDLRLSELTNRFGRDHAAAVWDAGLAAIHQIHEIVQREQLECEFAWVPGYLHSALEGEQDDSRELQRDAELARELGLDAEFLASVPLLNRPGVRFPNQAMFHPLKYLAGLVQRISGDGSYVFENTEARECKLGPDDGPAKDVQITANGCTISCDSVVIATDVPLAGLSNVASAAVLQTKLAPYTSYAVGAQLPKGRAPQASFWDTSDPYYFLRIAHYPSHDYAIFGGLDHKTGQVDQTTDRFAQLEATLRRFLPDASFDCRWSGQVIESQDGLPLIGETAKGQFVATGFSGNGLTFGTLAAIMVCDAACGRKNPWSELFDPRRAQIRGGAWNYIRENLDYPYYMLKDRMKTSEGQSLASLQRGRGRILKVDGRRTAAYRDAEGRITLLSPVCPHLGCIVHWNETESTWDCPCHGSRFHCTGKVLAGPAESPLKPL